MKDLIQCSIARNDFLRWLELGHAPFTVWQGEKAAATLIRLEKKPSVDYLYRIGIGQDGSISWNNGLSFCGVYDMQNRALYLEKDALKCFMEGRYPFIAEAGPSTVEEICGRVNQRVEEIIGNDQSNLPVREITDTLMLRDLQYYQEYGAKEEAIRQFFNGNVPDSQFHSGYKMDRLPEAAFLAYIQDPEGFIQTEANIHIKTNQEKFLLQFLKNNALLTEYQALLQDTGSPIHRMKAITDSVKASGAKTVTVTVQKEGQELTFKTAASSLTGHRNFYSTLDIPATDRREFEKLFGRHTDYNAEDITRITYGRNTIFEAPTAQTEDLAESMEMGGMQFG